MYNKNLLRTFLAGASCVLSTQLVVANDPENILKALESIKKSQARMIETAIETKEKAQQAVEITHRTEYELNKVAQELTTIKKHMRGSFVKNTLKKGSLVLVGATAVWCHEHKEVLKDKYQKYADLFAKAVSSTQENKEEKANDTKTEKNK